MYEQSSWSKARDALLDHPAAQSMDAHEYQALCESSKSMSLAELDAKLAELEREH